MNFLLSIIITFILALIFMIILMFIIKLTGAAVFNSDTIDLNAGSVILGASIIAGAAVIAGKSDVTIIN